MWLRNTFVIRWLWVVRVRQQTREKTCRHSHSLSNRKYANESEKVRIRFLCVLPIALHSWTKTIFCVFLLSARNNLLRLIHSPLPFHCGSSTSDNSSNFRIASRTFTIINCATGPMKRTTKKYILPCRSYLQRETHKCSRKTFKRMWNVCDEGIRRMITHMLTTESGLEKGRCRRWIVWINGPTLVTTKEEHLRWVCAVHFYIDIGM